MPMRADNGTLIVATNDPFNLSMIEVDPLGRAVAACNWP